MDWYFTQSIEVIENSSCQLRVVLSAVESFCQKIKCVKVSLLYRTCGVHLKSLLALTNTGQILGLFSHDLVHSAS